MVVCICRFGRKYTFHREKIFSLGECEDDFGTGGGGKVCSERVKQSRGQEDEGPLQKSGAESLPLEWDFFGRPRFNTITVVRNTVLCKHISTCLCILFPFYIHFIHAWNCSLIYCYRISTMAITVCF